MTVLSHAAPADSSKGAGSGEVFLACGGAGQASCRHQSLAYRLYTLCERKNRAAKALY